MISILTEGCRSEDRHVGNCRTRQECQRGERFRSLPFLPRDVQVQLLCPKPTCTAAHVTPVFVAARERNAREGAAHIRTCATGKFARVLATRLRKACITLSRIRKDIGARADLLARGCVCVHVHAYACMCVNVLWLSDTLRRKEIGRAALKHGQKGEVE